MKNPGRHRAPWPLVLLILCALATTVTVSCVGDSASTPSKQGAFGGACYANHTCDPGLVCVLSSSAGVCDVADGAVADTGADAPPSRMEAWTRPQT